MAVVIGTNSGFLTEAPTEDPTGSGNYTIDGHLVHTHDTSPATAAKITEVGWWCDDASEESNFEVGLYAADGAVVPGEAGTLLEVSRTNAKGTTAGWKSVAVDWTISPSTSYWLSVQVDSVVTATTLDYDTSQNGTGSDQDLNETTLKNPAGAGAFTANGCAAIYAVWSAGAVTPINTSINIGDAWKSVSGALTQINVGDAWKAVASTQINIGDAWKAAVFA